MLKLLFVTPSLINHHCKNIFVVFGRDSCNVGKIITNICGFSNVEDSDEEIKKKIYKMVKKYEKAIGDFKHYIVKSKLKEIEGDFK